MILNFILFIIIFYTVFLRLKIKKNKDLLINFYFFRLLFLFLVGFMFCIFYRLLNFFLGKTDLNVLVLLRKVIFFFQNLTLLNIIMFILLFLLLRKTVVLFFKKNFLVIHYYFLSLVIKNRGYNIYNFYDKIFYYLFVIFNNISISNKKKLIFYLFFKYFVLIILVMLVLFEIVFNNYILHYSLIFLPFFGLYQFI